MGIKGAKPKPKSVHIMQGTYEASRHEKIWNPITDDLVEPEWLSESAKEHFAFFRDTLRGIGCESSTFSVAVGNLAEAFAERMRLKAIAEETGGPVITAPVNDGHGRVIPGVYNVKANPAYKLFMDQDKRFFSMLTDFGLTPSAMSRLRGLEQPKKDNDPFADLMNSLSDSSSIQ